MSQRRAAAVLGAIALAVALAACGDDPAVSRAESRKVAALDTPGIPGTLHGLEVKRENVKDALSSTKRPYLDGAALFSLRDGDQLMATLQVGTFASDARWDDAEFRSSLLSTMGGSQPRALRMGDQTVYLSSGDRQALAVWFKDGAMYILASREDFDFPRGLLRDALDLEVSS